MQGKGKARTTEMFTVDGRQLGTDRTAEMAIALADGDFAATKPGLKVMKPERLHSLWKSGILLTEAECSALTAYLDEQGIGGRRPELGVSFRGRKADAPRQHGPARLNTKAKCDPAA